MQELKHTPRFLAIYVINPQMDKMRALYNSEELDSLISTVGGEIVERVLQRRENPDNGTYIGSGKVEEILPIIKEKKVDVVVLNAIAKPRQVDRLKRIFSKVNPEINVWDRVDLILNIFDKHANTTEAKLQIELARMRYMGPRIYGMGYVLSQQSGGIGTRGIGETNTELMKRHWRVEIKRVNDELEKLAKNKDQQIQQRKRNGLKTVSIVGYTNAGKSSLFNILTKKDTLVENALFATLSSTSGKLYLSQINQEILITDTIGFIRNLPMKLVNAFKSTLMESLNADILLHVIDISDPQRDEKIHIVNNILHELGRQTENVIYVFNKVDLVKDMDIKKIEEEYKDNTPVFISVKNRESIENILSLLSERLKSNLFF